MALYLGSKKLKPVLDKVVCCLNVYTSEPIVNGIKLLSSDNYTLRDIDGLYLTAKES